MISCQNEHLIPRDFLLKYFKAETGCCKIEEDGNNIDLQHEDKKNRRNLN